MKKRIGICDSDERYLRFMQEYLGKKQLTDFAIQIFTSVEETYQSSRQHPLEILLVGEGCFEECIKEIDAKKVYILQESSACEIVGFTKVMKYQSMERLISTVLEDYAQNVQPSNYVNENTSMTIRAVQKAKMSCFYTPLQTPSQTLYALALAQLLAKEGKRVLYLNLTPFAGFESLLQTTYETDVTDFFYYALKHSNRLGVKLDGMKQRLGGVDYLPPAMDFQDLLSLSAKEWMDGIRQLQCLGVYDELILDLSSASQGLYEIMQSCDQIYTIKQCGSHAKAAFTQFQELCIRRKQQNIVDCIYEIEDEGEMPEKVYYDTLVTSVYGQKMMNFLSGVFNKSSVDSVLSRFVVA